MLGPNTDAGVSPICDFTGRRHVQLTGRNKQGKTLTSLAQEYPKKLSVRLAHLLLHKGLMRRVS